LKKVWKNNQNSCIIENVNIFNKGENYMGRAHEVRKSSMAKTAAKKSKHNAKFAAAIYTAAKSGIPDPELNQVLKKEIEKAKKENVPTDVIKRALDKASGGNADDYTSIRYEGFGPNNSMFIIECLTDNQTRTYTDVRTIFSRLGYKLGVTGSVVHMFNNQALFSFEGLTDEETLDVLIMAECDVIDIQYDDGLTTIYAPSTEYAKIRDALTENNPDIEFLEDEIVWIPMMQIKLEDTSDIKHFQKLNDLLDDLEDVQQVFHNVEDIEDDEE